MYTYSDDIISDLYKDTYGVRPNEYFWEEWTEMDAEGKQCIWDNLVDQLKENEKLMLQQEELALAKFREQVRKQMRFAGVDWRKAVEYLVTAEGEDVDNPQSFGFYLWEHGIGYKDRQNIQRLYAEA